MNRQAAKTLGRGLWGRAAEFFGVTQDPILVPLAVDLNRAWFFNEPEPFTGGGRARFGRQVPLGVAYKGKTVGEARLDLLVNDCLVVELEAVDAIAPIHVAQVISYLKATRLALGLLITFNVTVLQRGIRRVIQTH